jgi:hypothetical protein
VKVGIYNSANDRRIWETAISAEWAGGPPGGSFEARSDVLDCGASVGIPAYARAFDSTKGAWSGKVALTAGNCRNL